MCCSECFLFLAFSLPISHDLRQEKIDFVFGSFTLLWWCCFCQAESSDFIKSIEIPEAPERLVSSFSGDFLKLCITFTLFPAAGFQQKYFSGSTSSDPEVQLLTGEAVGRPWKRSTST